MSRVLDSLRALSVSPKEPQAFEHWLEQEDATTFLNDNGTAEEIVIYAALPYAFIHAVLVPAEVLSPPDIPDLLSWNYNPYSSWGVMVSQSEASIEPPLASAGSKSISKGEQLVFMRSFEGITDRRHYVEILQKLIHTSDLHYMHERSAWCRLDRHGDIEDVIRVVKLPPQGDEIWGGTVVLMKRTVLGEYATLTNTTLVRMFDFTRFRPGNFSGWHDQREEQRSEGDIHFRYGVQSGQASYARGVQIIPIAPSREELARRFQSGTIASEKQYATFIAHDWKNDRVAEISCAPDQLANYFTKSNLPFEITPAFFRPEVLLKYKSDREKYTLEERSVSCRGSWHLETFDINESGQVHTYLIYLSRLPYEEQLHWKQYNEPPKGPISKRAFTSDIKGEVYLDHNPLGELKQKLRDLHRRRVPWWTLHNEDLIDQSNYPFTASAEEWAGEILTLDQLLVEGFDEKWLRAKAKQLGRDPAQQFRSLKLVEECLAGLSFDHDHAATIVSPLHELHNLRSKLKGHAPGDTAKSIKSDALTNHGTFRNHFTDLAKRCDEALATIIEVFQDPRMQ